uniref:Secreted protein n=1 Tax=Steinernema glaseri TaxID=37863 RepID=A0A1I7Y389_9BILA
MHLLVALLLSIALCVFSRPRTSEALYETPDGSIVSDSNCTKGSLIYNEYYAYRCEHCKNYRLAPVGCLPKKDSLEKIVFGETYMYDNSVVACKCENGKLSFKHFGKRRINNPSRAGLACVLWRKKDSRCAKSKDGSLPGPLIPEDIDMPAMEAAGTCLNMDVIGYNLPLSLQYQSAPMVAFL